MEEEREEVMEEERHLRARGKDLVMEVMCSEMRKIGFLLPEYFCQLVSKFFWLEKLRSRSLSPFSSYAFVLLSSGRGMTL